MDRANAAYVLRTLIRIGQNCLDGYFVGVITALAHRGVINEVSIPFSGHTEFLADLTHTVQVVMVLAIRGLRVALATAHPPLRGVANVIDDEHLSRVACILHADLRDKFGIAHPRIPICELNPHAGEGNHLDREETKVIEPCLERLRGESLGLIGPLPADTLFTPKHLKHCDVMLAIYHDQGLPVLKYKGLGITADVTPGLSIICTPVDHGTVLDLAGSGRIDSGSLQIALETAYQVTVSHR